MRKCTKHAQFWFWVQFPLKSMIMSNLPYMYWFLKNKNDLVINYRLMTAYLLLRVNLDKIMHARWDFDVSSARVWVHWTSIKIEVQVHYFV